MNEEKVIKYLTELGYIGILYTSVKTHKQIIGLLVPIHNALDQIAYKFKKEISKADFMNILKRSNISVFNSPTEFTNAKKEADKTQARDNKVANLSDYFKREYEALKTSTPNAA